MKRILLTVLVVGALVGVLAGVGLGSAASTGPVTPNTLQAGIAQIQSGDGVALEYLTHFGGDAKSYVYGMKVTGVDAAAGNWVLIGLFSDEEWPITSGASQIAMLRGDVDGSGVAIIDEIYKSGWVAWGMGPNAVKAEDIRAVSVVVKSTNE